MTETTTTTNRSLATRLQSMLNLVAVVIRILLWPLRSLSRLVFPPNDLDGLSPAVTSKAARSFVTMLQKEYNIEVENWSTTGFADLKNTASETSSLVLVYLHSPLHRQSHVVLERVFTNASFQQFLQQPNLVAMGCSIHSGQGAQLAQMLHAASYPLMALLQPTRNNLQLLFQIQGPKLLQLRTAETLTGYLSTALTRHQVVLAEQEARRIQQEQEAQLRREQDEEYHAALRADQERVLRQQEEEEARVRAEQEAIAQALREEQEQQSALQQARDLIRPPPQDGGVRIRFVLPSGKKLERRFECEERIASLKAYLKVQFHDSDDMEGFERIGLSTNYPKQTYEDDNVTLEEAGLSPQAVLMVQDLDA